MAFKTSSYTTSLLLTLVASMLIHSPPCLANLPIQELGFLEGLLPLQPCLAALANTGGCVGELDRFKAGQDTKFKDVCCKSIIQIDDDCWSKILPFQPFFPTMMKSYCTTLIRPAGAVGGVVGGAAGGAAGGVVGGAPGGVPGGVVGGGPGSVVGGLPGGVVGGSVGGAVGGAAGGALPTPPY